MRFMKHRLAMVSSGCHVASDRDGSLVPLTILAPYITSFKDDELNVNDYFRGLSDMLTSPPVRVHLFWHR